MLGDVHIAEKAAQIGFAGARVIESTIRETLPEGFQRAEYLLDHGMVDIVVDRKDLKATLGRVLSLLTRPTPAGDGDSDVGIPALNGGFVVEQAGQDDDSDFRQAGDRV